MVQISSLIYRTKNIFLQLLIIQVRVSHQHHTYFRNWESLLFIPTGNRTSEWKRNDTNNRLFIYFNLIYTIYTKQLTKNFTKAFIKMVCQPSFNHLSFFNNNFYYFWYIIACITNSEHKKIYEICYLATNVIFCVKILRNEP